MPAEQPTPARLLIADDHELAREGVRAMLDHDPHLEILPEATNGREALHLCQRWRPDLVLATGWRVHARPKARCSLSV